MSTETTYVEIQGNRIRYNLEFYLKESGRFIIGYIPYLDIYFHGMVGTDIEQRAANLVQATFNDFADSNNYPLKLLSYLHGLGFRNPHYETIMAKVVKKKKVSATRMTASEERNRVPVGYKKSLQPISNQKSVA